MKVTYIGHSGYLVELEHTYLLFDFYEGKLPLLDYRKKLYVFASHSHEDHYSKRIWGLRESGCKVQYILSSDIQVHPAQDIYSVYPMREYDYGDIKVETFLSTDIGEAFLVECEGKTVYHAGDLHFWAWHEEGEDYVESVRQQFLEAIRGLEGRHVDVAFYLLDSRLGEGTYDGIDLYRKIIDADHVFPMHMWNDYVWCERYLEDRRDTKGIEKFHAVSHKGQEFLLEG